MRTPEKNRRRQGGILPMVAFSMVALTGFVALSVDLGMVAMARTQAQQIADTAAFTAARSLTGGSSPSLTVPVTNGQAVATGNTILGDAVLTADVTIQLGAYHYDSTQQTFLPQYPAVSPDNYNLATATVVHSHPSPFARVMGIPIMNVTASATAAHRPRDVCIVLDYSGSMNNESDLWNAESYTGSFINTSNNADPIFPQWGPYDPSFSPLAALQQTSTDPRVGMCNITQAVLGVPAMVDNFLQSNLGVTPTVPAFNLPPSSVTVTTPGGDQYLPINGGTAPARTWKDITGSASVGFNGYSNFKGWTQGPGYWGKTFFIWPPDPRPANDWRKKFFMLAGGSYPNFGGPLNDNTQLWDSGGVWNGVPNGNYVINYKAILAWISANCVQSSTSDPKPFPPVLRAGPILYYNYIPTDVPAAAYDHTRLNTPYSSSTNPNGISWPDDTTRFWKEYIDYTLGVWRDPYGNIQCPVPNSLPACSLGPDYTCGSSTGGNGVSITGPDKTDPNGRSYIASTDNPKRPRHRFWFGPMTMIQFMSDTGLLPGTAKDVSMSVAKLGVNGALVDIQNNHPNDLVSMILFNRPQFTNDPPGTGTFNNVQYSLSRNYSGMINSLWYPPNTTPLPNTNTPIPSSAPFAPYVTPWDSNGLQTPRAHADYNANTATEYGLMLAYNQLSSNSTLATTQANGQSVGGLGRKGAQRFIVLETDGMANEGSVEAQGFANNGANNSYYHIVPGDSVNGASYSQANLLSVVQAICNKTDGTPGTTPGYSPNPGYPGYATTTKPVLIHTLAFGVVFEPTASGGEAANAVSLLQQISTIGGTTFPSSSTDPTNGYKWIIGTLDQRQTKLKQAFGIIMDSGVSVSLVR